MTPTLLWDDPSGPRTRLTIDKPVFRIGRDPENDHVVTGDLGGVSSFHLEIHSEDGRLFVEDVGSTNGTFLDGRKLGSERAEVRPGQTVTLGRKGPRFRIEAAAELADDGRTIPERLAEDAPSPNPGKGGIGEVTLMRKLDEVQGRERRRTMRVVAAALGAMLVLSLTAFWWINAGSREWPYFESYRDSVWKVCKKTVLDNRISYESVGTAWNYREGYLATNAHVAAVKKELRPDQKLVARVMRRSLPVEVEIGDVRIHPHWEVFNSLLQGYMPLFGDGPMMARGQFDVALMTVRAEDREKQGAVLPIATPAESNALRVSQTLYYVGYPAENTMENPERPDARFLQGPCARLVTWQFDPATGLGPTDLVGYQMSLTGGSSGGPVFDRSGRVVALNAAADFIFDERGQRIPSGTMYGVPASLLAEIDGTAAPADRERELRTRIIELYRKGVSGREFLQKVKEQFLQRLGTKGFKVVNDSLRESEASSDLREGEVYPVTLSMPEMSVGFVIAVPDATDDLPMVLALGNRDKESEQERGYCMGIPYAPWIVLFPNGERSRSVAVGVAPTSATKRGKVRVFTCIFQVMK